MIDKGIGIADTVESAVRLKGNASGNDLQVVKAKNLRQLLNEILICSAIVKTGKKATETLFQTFGIE